MGISISHSDSNIEIQMIRERKKLKRKQMIESQLQQSASDMRQGAALKQNKERNTAPNLTPNRTLTKTSEPAHLQNSKLGSIGQRKKQINKLRLTDQIEQPLQKYSSNIGNHESIHQSKHVGQMINTNDKLLKASWKKTDQKVNYRAQPLKQAQIKNQAKDKRNVRQSATIELRRSQTKTWKNGKDPEVEAEKMKIQIQRVSFNQYDWTIPAEGEEKQSTIRRVMMPSMNFVLQNKLAENISNYNLEEDEQIAAKNRRKVMRQLLSGKRDTGDEDFKLPSCNFRNLKVSSFCQRK